MPHIHEKIDYVSVVFIVNKDAVLLRIHDKHKTWLAPGGHIELYEDPVEAAYREIKEEVGIPISIYGDVLAQNNVRDRDILAPQFLNRHSISDSHEHICFVYFATSETRDTNPQEGETTDDFKWFTKEELNDPLYGVSDGVRMHAGKALEMLSF